MSVGGIFLELGLAWLGLACSFAFVPSDGFESRRIGYGVSLSGERV